MPPSGSSCAIRAHPRFMCPNASHKPEPVLLRERDDRFSSFLRCRVFAAELVELSSEMRGDEQPFRVPDVLSGRQSALGPIEGGIRVAKCPRRARCITRVDHQGRLSGMRVV